MVARRAADESSEAGTFRRLSIQDDVVPSIELSSAPGSTERPPGDVNLDALRGNSYEDVDIARVQQSAVTDLITCYDHGDQMFSTLEREEAAEQSPFDDSNNALEYQLRAALRKHADPTVADFLPIKQLQKLLTPNKVKQELMKCPKLNQNRVEEYTAKICGESLTIPDDRKRSSKRIFAILVLMSRVKTIPDFLQTGVTDADLPFQKHGEFQGRFDLCRKGDQDNCLECFSSWKQDHIARFYDWQWRLLAPFFSKGREGRVQFYDFEDEVILPWVSDSRFGKDGQDPLEVPGGYSVVWKVKIHPEHHDFHNLCPADAGFAVKRLGSQKRQVFKKEVDILKKFSACPHPHLISLLATFKLSSQYYLLFPWAEGDLLKFWEDDMPTHGQTPRLSRWMCRQCLGLASGLAAIHLYKPIDASNEPGKLSIANVDDGNEKNRGRHGDIKPENILRFTDPNDDGGLGVLQISDFGLAVFNSRYSASGQSTQGLARTPTYRPPEADIEGGTVSRSWDIWTLGCLYLEFLTWLLGGSHLFTQFRDYRLSPDIWGTAWLTDIYFEVVKTSEHPQLNAMMVKPSVTNWIRKLHANDNCTEFVHDFLNLIETRMLIVESDNPPSKRAACETVKTELDIMHKKCQSDTQYCLEPVAWKLEEADKANLVAVVVPLNAAALTSDRVTSGDLRIHTGRTRTVSGALD